jgi:DNA-directed RNA polymerase subunit RPC12/RpoP
VTIKLECGGCGKMLTVEDSAQGRTVKCPRCASMVSVPVQTVVLPIALADEPAPPAAFTAPPPLPRPKGAAAAAAVLQALDGDDEIAPFERELLRRLDAIAASSRLAAGRLGWLIFYMLVVIGFEMLILGHIPTSFRIDR